MIREAPILIEPKPRWVGTAPAKPVSRAFRLDPALPLGEAIRATMLAQLDGAIAASAKLPHLDDPIERVAAVRIARKATKRLRAILPLLEDPDGEAALAARREALRRCGRLFSAIRDRDVRGETIASIARTVRPRLADEEERDALEAIVDFAGGRGGAPRSDDAIAREAAAALVELRHGLGSAVLADVPWSALRRRTRRDWRGLRRRLRRDLGSGCDERLHGARKSCGRLETRLLLVEALDPRRLRMRRRRLSAIYDDLGADRDLALAASWLCRTDLAAIAGAAGDRAVEALLDSISRERRRIRRRLARGIARLPRSRRGAWRAIRRDPMAPKEPMP